MKITLVITALFLTFTVDSQELYSKAFGNQKDPAIIFLHGGPGYNSASFEATTAKRLSEEGFYVIVYDRRGEGRSKDAKAKFNFKESFKDLKSLYDTYKLEESTLIGHSFGGIVATKFTKKYPNLVSSLVLVGAPVSLQESFVTIIETSKKIYEEKDDRGNLKYINMLADMDNRSLEFAVYCFAHAMQNGFYSPDSLTAEATEIYKDFRADTILSKYAGEMTQAGTQGFWKQENYTTIDLTEDLKKLKSNGQAVYGMYGKEDGLYSSLQIGALKKIIGANQLVYLDNCSHSVFIDQQTEFISTLKKWLMK